MNEQVNAIMVISSAIIPLVMLIIGTVFKNNAPKKINTVVGYRTRNSMKSQEAWEYANKSLGETWKKFGLICLIVALIIMIGVSVYASSSTVIVGVLIMVVEVVIMIVTILPIEKELKEKF